VDLIRHIGEVVSSTEDSPDSIPRFALIEEANDLIAVMDKLTERVQTEWSSMSSEERIWLVAIVCRGTPRKPPFWDLRSHFETIRTAYVLATHGQAAIQHFAEHLRAWHAATARLKAAVLSALAAEDDDD
jgi:hypothetical protein